LHAAMNNIQDEIDLVGESAASIDAYAATDPAECFAVLSEYFFSAPELFAPRFPASILAALSPTRSISS
ncbi:zinc-dependent peptidase, partial [Salmonella enterica]|uniref:zinc-dependent peptidase n=1 Tax=Salmonella enterica TaxID=28901 RepID=UPI0039EF2939|nr:hypothetical protein [Salmonella enterica subsp. enterica serovar Enteritidis]